MIPFGPTSRLSVFSQPVSAGRKVFESARCVVGSWAASDVISSLAKALYVVHWLIWRIPRVMPAGLVPRLALIGVALTASALGIAVNRVRGSSGISGAVIAIVVITVASFALWWWVSWKLPHPPVPARALVNGASQVSTGGAWVGARVSVGARF